MSQDEKKKALLARIKIVDPVGQITACAKNLWQEAGKPAGSDWTDYFAEAEELLTAGRGGEAAGETASSSVKKTSSVGEHTKQIDLAISALSQSSFNLHEATCLATILQNNQFSLEGFPSPTKFNDTEITRILSESTIEYEEDYLRECSVSSSAELSLAQKNGFWRRELEKKQGEDCALSFHDLNTISRLEKELREKTEIREMKILEKRPELG